MTEHDSATDPSTPRNWLARATWVLVAGSVVHWLVLVLEVPMPPGWFWQYEVTPLPWVWLIVPLVAIAIAAIRFLKTPGLGTWPSVLTLVALGFVTQWTFALMEGRGIEPLRERTIYSYHADYFDAAARQPSVLTAVREYETRVHNAEFGGAAHTKPPGQLLLFMLTDRLGQLAGPSPSEPERVAWLRTLSCWLWPLIASAAVIPIFLLGQLLRGRELAITASLLYVATPSFALITLHTDQVFFPLFAASCTLWLVRAAGTGRLLPAALAGAAINFAAFFTFPIVLCAPVAFGIALGAPRRQPLNVWRFVGGASIGFVVAAVLLWAALDYDLITRFRSAMEYHEEWKQWIPGARSHLYFGLLNLLEFALWIGVPLAMLTVNGWYRAIESALRRRLTARHGLAMATLGVTLLLAVFGRTMNEVARMWLFLLPWFVLIGAVIVARRPTALPLVLGLQLATTLLTKWRQDFF